MKVIERAGWGAAPPRDRQPLPADDARGVAVHYSASGSDEQALHRNCAGRVRAIQRFHIEQRGWLDIAYNHVFCKHGYVFDGRGYGIRSAANGTNDGNGHYFAVCFLGDDRAGRDDVTEVGRRALSELIDEYRRRYPRAREVRPHSRFVATECPGDELRAFIAAAGWNRYVSPVPVPRWLWAWARWRLRDREAPRPRAAPPRVGEWAWRRLREIARRTSA
jgi:hypothetical protein